MLNNKKKYIIYGKRTLRNSPYTNLIIASSNTLHSHEFWEFAISLSGECVNRINGKDLIIKEGNVVLMRPDDIHDIHSFANRHIHRDIYVTYDKMKRICDAISPDLYENLSSGKEVIDFYIPKILLDKLKEDLNYIGTRQGVEDVEDFHSAVVTFILSYWFTSRHNMQDMPKEIIDLLQKINSGVYLSCTIEEIARSTNFSHGYLCRLFRRFVGISLNEYVRNFKLSYSLSLLANYDLSIIQIANMLQYDTPSAFSNAFKKKFGMSPKFAREQMFIDSEKKKKNKI